MSETHYRPRILDAQGMGRMKTKRRMKKTIIWVGVIVAIIGIFALVGGQGKPSSQAAATGATQGMMAPDFSLPSTMDTTYTLSSYRGKQPVLLYFHEGVTCDPCMQQMPDLDKYKPDFDKLNVQMFYVALDSPNTMKKAVAKYNLQTPVLSYENAKVDQDYNLLNNSMGMGRRAGHTFVLVGKDGKIIWRKDYYVGKGMDGPATNTMSVPGSEILSEVKKALGSNT